MQRISSSSVTKSSFNAVKKFCSRPASDGYIQTGSCLDRVSPTRILLLSQLVVGTDFGVMVTIGRALLATKILKR